MDFTIFEENFTILIGIFVALVVMGTTTLYDRHKSKGGASFELNEFKLFSDLSPKMTAIGSEFSKQFSELSKKLSSSIKKMSESIPKNSGSTKKKSGSSQTKSGLIQSNSGNNFLKQVEPILLKAKDAVQKFFSGFHAKISSLSSSLPRKNPDEKEKSVPKLVPLSNDRKEDLDFSEADKVNNLDKIVESKKDELDFDDDFLTNMSTSNTLTASIPEAEGPKPVEPSLDDISSDLDMSFDNDFSLDDNEFAIKVDGLDDEPELEDNFAFNENVQEIKFDDDKDSLLDSLKKDIVVTQESKINFMDNLKEENLDLQLMKSDLEDVLKDLKKYKQIASNY